MTGRAEDIIHTLLAKHGVGRYWLIDLTPEYVELPGSAYYQEVVAQSGILITPDHVYHFELGWEGEYYTLGNKGESWPELTAEDTTEENWRKILQLQQKMQNDPLFGLREPPASPVREVGRPTTREAQIIWWWLASSHFFAECDLTDYPEPIFEVFEIIDVQSGGHDLVGSLLPGEVQDISGIVVVAQGAFHFRLSWVWGPENVLYHHPGHYSLGEEDGSWRPVLQEECTEEQWQQIQGVRQRLAQVFAQLPRNEHAIWRDLAEEEKRASEEKKESSAEMLRRSPRSERRPRIPRQLRRVSGGSQQEE